MKKIDKDVYFNKIGYTPHSDGQRSYHNSKARFRIPVCGRRFGKSQMAGKDTEPQLLLPKKMFWIVGPTYDLTEKEFRPIWDDLIVKLRFGDDKRTKKAYNKRSGEMFIELPWGTRIECRSAAYPETLVGESLDGVIMSEAAKQNLETWERFIRPSLSDKLGWASFPTTPEGQNWLYDLWRHGQNPDLPDYQSWRFPSWDNPIVYPGGRNDPEILLLEQTMSPEAFMQEIGADFTSFVGKIYPEFDEQIHVRKVNYNPAWKNYMGWDWGFTNPLANVEFQIDPWDNIYIWREHYRALTQLDEHLRIMRDRSQPDDYKIDLTFGDAADPEAAIYVSQNFAPCIADPNAKTNWREGIELVKSFLRTYKIGESDEYGTPIEAPKLYIDHSCVNTIKEFANYRAAEGTQGRNAQETDKRTANHAMDALRYALVHIFKLGSRYSLGDVNVYSDSMLSSAAPEGGYFSVENMNF